MCMDWFQKTLYTWLLTVQKREFGSEGDYAEGPGEVPPPVDQADHRDDGDTWVR